MESALYGIYALVFVSEILLVRCAHSFDFWYVNNSCVNTVRQHFPWSILYLLAKRVREQMSNDVSADGKPPDLETGSRALFREPNRFTLPPLRSSSAGNRRTSLQDNLTSHVQTCPMLTSSMAVTMQAALLPISATLQTHGSCLEIIRIKTEERATVSRQGVVLPPITRQKKRVWCVVFASKRSRDF